MLEYLRLVSEFNWWNPLNCVASFLGGAEGKRAVREHWRQACAPGRLARSLEASADLVYKRLLRFFNERKFVPILGTGAEIKSDDSLPRLRSRQGEIALQSADGFPNRCISSSFRQEQCHVDSQHRGVRPFLLIELHPWTLRFGDCTVS